MKKTLSMAFLLCVAIFGALQIASAGTTNIYTENWGTGLTAGGNGTLNTVGWTGVAVSETTGPYLGIYTATGPSDAGSGESLPANTVYFTVLLPTQTNAGMFYTTDTAGAGANGNSAFVDINPTLYTNLTLSVEVRDDGGTPTNYFAVQVGGSWYVATSYQLPSSGALAFPVFTNATLAYTNTATVWNNLTINATDVTIGSVASLNLSATITGIGIVELPTTGGFDYNRLAVQIFVPNPPPPTPPTATTPISQTVYQGGGASFLTVAGGTQPRTFFWQTNAVTLNDGNKYAGTTTTTLTISNANAADAAATYSLTVTNLGGSTNASGAFTLTVNPVPAGYLYAETLPYVGPSGNLGLAGVGWAQAVSGTSRGIFQNGTGNGVFFDFSTPACTNIYFTTVTNDTGQSGLPFVAINPASWPAVTLQAELTPGNGAGTTAANTTLYWAVQMNGVWYSSRSTIAKSLVQNVFSTNQLGFNPVATNWNNLTIAGNVVTIGSQASSDLTGNITGAGMVFVHTASGASMNFDNFVIMTNAVTIPPTVIGTSYPIDVSVPSGGGASFGVAASGQLPFTYSWKTNGVTVGNGGRVSGATNATLTIANLTSSDDGMQIIAYVTNSFGNGDESDTFTGNPTILTVTNPPVGQIYLEQFPFVGPVTGNYPISSVGWTEAVSGTPFTVFRRGTAGTTSQGDGAVFAFLGSAGTTVYYTTRASDTNQAGLPFPDIKLGSYPDLSISADIAPASASATNVTAYLAVQLNGINWYVAASALLGPNAASNSAYSTYTTAFSPTAANWKNLAVIGGTGGAIGSTAASDLGGVMTGVGLVFVTVGTGGTFNFDNIAITGTGLGGINVGPLTGGSLSLSWVGNPAVKLQSSTNLSSSIYWQDVVPNTLGLYSLPVSVTGPQMFFRLIGP